jgi:hypothetical protein
VRVVKWGAEARHTLGCEGAACLSDVYETGGSQEGARLALGEYEGVLLARLPRFGYRLVCFKCSVRVWAGGLR